jgi:hypothetical protein
VPQQLAGGDIYPALEKGTIDAAEWVGPYDDEKLGFNKVAPHYYYPGWWEGGPMLLGIVNLDKWNSLPKYYQSVIEQAGQSANSWMMAKYDQLNPPSLKKLLAGGTKLHSFSPPIMQACLKATKELYAETSATNPNFKKVLESMNSFTTNGYQWFRSPSSVTTALWRAIRKADCFLSSPTNRTPGAKAPGFPRHRLCLEAPGGVGWLCLAGSEHGKCHVNGRALSQSGDERDSTAELLRHEIMDDVQAEPGAALRTSGGEERIEDLTLNFLRNAVAVIRENDLDLFHAEATRLDQHVSARSVGEAVSDGVEDEVGQHLSVGARVAVEGDVGGYLDCK